MLFSRLKTIVQSWIPVYFTKGDWDIRNWYRALSSRKKVGFILFGSVGMFFVLIFAGVEPKSQEPQERIWRVSTQKVVYKNIQPYLEKFGIATATRRLLLKVLIPGEVFTVESFRDGAFVSAGETILSLDPEIYELDLIEAQNRLLQAQQNLVEARKTLLQEQKLLTLREQQQQLHETLFKRLESLAKTDTVSAKNLDNAHLRFLQAQEIFIIGKQRFEQQTSKVINQEAIFSSAQVAYDRAQRNLENTVLIAPFDGVISAINIAKGQSLSVREQIGVLYDPSSYEVRVTLTPSEYGRIVSSTHTIIGKKLKMFQNMGNTINSYQGVITRVGAVMSKETASIPVYAMIETHNVPSPFLIKENSFMRILIPDVLYKHVVELPIAALYGSTVYTINDENRLEKHYVQVVQNLGDTVLVTGDIINGERILTTHFSAAATGVKVRFKH